MSTDEFAPFWMVYGFGQGSPTYRHATERKALAEATRLANLHPDIKFCVMQSTLTVEKQSVVVKRLSAGRFVEVCDDGIPF